MLRNASSPEVPACAGKQLAQLQRSVTVASHQIRGSPDWLLNHNDDGPLRAVTFAKEGMR
jgi:hypothetical protein